MKELKIVQKGNAFYIGRVEISRYSPTLFGVWNVYNNVSDIATIRRPFKFKNEQSARNKALKLAETFLKKLKA